MVFAAGFIVVWAVSPVGRVLIWKSFMLSASRLGVVWFSRAAWLRLAAAILPLELLGATVSLSYSWLFSYSFQLLSLVGTLFSILAFGALRRMKEDLIPLIPSAPS